MYLFKLWSWWYDLYLYRSTFYLKVIQTPNFLRTVFSVFLAFEYEFPYEGVWILYLDFRIFLDLDSWYVVIECTFLVYWSIFISYILFALSCTIFHLGFVCSVLLLLFCIDKNNIQHLQKQWKWWQSTLPTSHLTSIGSGTNDYS